MLILFLKSLVFYFLSYLNIIGYSLLFTKPYFKINRHCLFSNFIFGSIAIIFISYSLNMFFPLNQYITNSFFIVFTIIGFIKFKKLLFKNFKILFFLVSFASLITVLSRSYNDYELYHLPYMELIRSFKIIFGLSNLDFRYAHPSVFQNISAFQYNQIMRVDSYIFYTVSLFAISLFYLYRIFKKTQSNIIFLISFISLVYFLIHGNRYGALGNDLPTHLLAIISIILWLQIKTHSYHFRTKQLLFLTIITILILSKFSMIFFILLPLSLMIKKKFIYERNLLFIFLVGLLFLVKNIINSSCFVYPIPKLCINTNWSVNEISFGSPLTISTQSSASVKAFMESNYFLDPIIKDKFILKKFEDKNFVEKFDELSLSEKQEIIDYEFYVKYLDNKIWMKEYFKSKELKKFFEKIILLNLLIFLIIFFIKQKNKKEKSRKFFFLITIKENLFLFSFLTFNFLFWFFNFPQIRYGISYILLFFSIPSCLYFGNFNKNLALKIFNSFILITIFYSLSFNVVRLLNFSENEDFVSTQEKLIVPVSEPKKLRKYEFENIILSQPIEGVCSIQVQLCSVFSDRFIATGRKISTNKFKYIFIK